MSVTLLQINTDSPLLFMMTPEDNLTTGHQNQQGKEKKKKKKHKRHTIDGADLLLGTAEMTEQGLSVDQEPGIERKKKIKHKHQAENGGVSIEVKGKEKKNRQTEHGQEVNGLETFDLEEHILNERKKKTKSSCNQSELRAQCETVAGADDGAEVSTAEEHVSELTPQKVLQDRKKKKKRIEKCSDQCELSIQCKTKDGTESSQPEVEIPQIKKRKKGNCGSDQTELSILGETEEGTESSQPEVEIPQKKKRETGNRSSYQTKLSIRRETEDGTESSQQEIEIPQKKKRKKENRSSDQTELSIRGETENGIESSQPEVEIPKKKKRETGNRSSYQTELSIRREAEDGTESSQQELEIPQKKKRKEGNRSSDQTELSIRRETEDGTESSQQEIEIPQKKKRETGNRSSYQTELSIHREAEDGTESSQQELEIPQKKKRKKGNRSSDQTELSIRRETEDGTESSQQEIEILQKKKRKKGNRSSDQTELSIRGGTEDGIESSQPEVEVPEQTPKEIRQETKKRKRKRESSCSQTESNVQGEIEDDLETSKQRVDIPEQIPLGILREKKKKKKKRMSMSNSGETGLSIPRSMINGKRDQTESSIQDQCSDQNIEQRVDDWQLKRMEYIDELKEFIPNIEKKSMQTVVHLMKYDLLRFREFKKAGVSLSHGRYSYEEEAKLRTNVLDFLALTGIDSGTKLFFPSRFPEERAHIEKMKKQYKFYLRMSDGICRPWHDIYSKGRKLFDSHKIGRFTEDEVNSLQKLYTLHGSNWMKIAELTGRNNNALQKRISQLSVNKGPWTDDELQSLEGALRDHLVALAEPGADGPTIRRDQLYSNLPWTKVAERVGTRSWDKCRTKWMGILKKRMAEATEENPGCNSSANKIRFIRTLHALEIEDEADINWEDLTKVFGDVTPHYVQLQFHRLKTRRVPKWQALSFGEIIDFLYKNALPELEKLQRLIEPGTALTKPEREEDVRNQQESFLLSNIFSDI